jgi:hypothetical protein
MPQPYLHSFYRIWFTTIDPTILLFTSLTCIFSPATILSTFLPPAVEAYSPLSHGPLLHQSAALYGFMGVMFAVLLRASPDPKVWRIVQTATLGVDVALLGVMYGALKQQGRLGLGMWETGDWFNAGFTIWVAVIRGAFLMGVGGGEGERKTR